MLRGRGCGVDCGMAGGLTTEGHSLAAASTATRRAELVQDVEGGAGRLVLAGSSKAILCGSLPPGLHFSL